LKTPVFDIERRSWNRSNAATTSTSSRFAKSICRQRSRDTFTL
jgi:hypothetical protein